MTTFVLVPGFWLGGWAWEDVAGPLWDAGHGVHPVSLALEPGVTVDDHVEQVAAVIRELDDVVLVGHSYAGTILPAVVDRVPGKVGHLIFVDSGPMPDGMSQADFDGSQPVAVDGMMPVPAEAPPTAIGFDWAIVRERGRAQPIGTATTPIRHSTAWQAISRTAVICSFTKEQLLSMAPTFPPLSLMVEGDWNYRELRTGHWPMFSAPRLLAEELLAAYLSKGVKKEESRA